MRTTDRGLQKAIKRQPHYELPSNFSYRMMQKITRGKYLMRKSSRKKGMFILFLIFAILSGGRLHRIFSFGNTEQPSSAIGTPVRKYFRTPIRSFSTCLRSAPSVCCTSSTDGYGKKIDLAKKIVYLIFSHKRLQTFHKKYPEAWAPQFFAHSIPT